MSTFLCKNGVRKEYFLTPTFIIEPKYRVVIGKEIVDKNKKIDEQNCKNKGACLPCFDDEKA